MYNFSTKETVENMIMEESYDRPLGVSLLAILLIFGGASLLFVQLISFGKLNEASSAMGVTSYFFQGAVAFLGLLGVAAGIGTWLGKKWGWWLALFYFAYAVTRNMNVLLIISDISSQYQAAMSGMAMAYVKYALRALWNCALLYYLCRETVTSYFGTTDTKKGKALLIVFGICISLFVIGTIF